MTSNKRLTKALFIVVFTCHLLANVADGEENNDNKNSNSRNNNSGNNNTNNNIDDISNIINSNNNNSSNNNNNNNNNIDSNDNDNGDDDDNKNDDIANNNNTTTDGRGNLIFSLGQDEWMTTQVLYCNRRCENGTVVTGEWCTDFDCFYCTCDEHCHLLGTCCPSYHSDTGTYKYRFEASIEKNPHQWYNNIDCWASPYSQNTKPSYITVVKCPLAWTDTRMRDKCENPGFDSMASLTPFSDLTTGLVFPNAYCAICNGLKLPDKQQNVSVYPSPRNGRKRDSGLYPWPLKVTCGQYQNLYTITDAFDFFKAAILPENNCTVAFETPMLIHQPPRHCERQFSTKTKKRGCDSTLTTMRADNICYNVPAVPALTVNGYSNMFCLMSCENRMPELERCKARSFIIEIGKVFSGGVVKLPPMFLLFSPISPALKRGKVVVKDEESIKDCPPGFWMNYQVV